jgi:hypothetical protein
MKVGDGTTLWNDLPYYVGYDLLALDSDLIPATGGTYDIGATAGYSWRDLYLSGNTIYLGDATLSAVGSSVSMDTCIIGGPTADGGVILSATGGYLTSNGTLAVGPTGATGPAGAAGPTGGGGATLIEITYSELYSEATGGSLVPGAYYLITDFQTCYDQPDYNFEGSAITTGNYKQGPIEPIVVLSTSANTISNIAYQPTYPNDKIAYDWTWNQTEITNGPAKGRITERIDEFNNRTDYDHRVVLFRRYENYYYKEKDIAKGTIELIQNTGEVIGTGTEFSNYNIGDYIAIPNSSVLFFEVVSISADTSMVVSGLTIPAVLSGSSFYSAQKDGLTYKQNNISIDYTEHPTFLFDDETIISNYVGDVASFIDWSQNTFLLPNNVFGEDVIGNRIGNNFRNNTFNSDVEHNIIGDQFEYNTIYNDEDFTDNQIAANFRYNLIICDNFNDNVIGDNCDNNKIFNNINFVDNQIGVGFNNNTIYDDFEDNKIGNGFDNNIVDGNFNHNSIGNEFNNNEIFSQFYDNLIANEFINNTVYSDFYKNQILDYFNDNVIGDFANYGNFEFYRNYIRNNFNENVIRQDFQNNQIGTNFQENEINGEFEGNTILNGFNNNTTGSDFRLNNIGNAFNDNTIYDDFYHNTTDYYFNDNIISNDFNTNKVGTYFRNNRPSNNDLFGWNDLSTVSTRTYNTLRISLSNSVGYYILGKELVMRVISTSQYFRIKFTQWTQGGNGGGFQYERQEMDSNGNNIGSFVVFTKTNNGSEVDIIVPGVVELTRDSQGGLYNTITDTPPFNNQWPGPGDTEWNSIYTQQNNGERFAYNTIGNNFRNNIIGSDFGYGGGDPYGNIINDNFENNIIGQFAYNNVIGNEFKGNTIGDNFEDNSIKNYFEGNTISNNFESNEVGNEFSNNSIGNTSRNNKINDLSSNNIIGNGLRNNVIGNNFSDNNIGKDFRNNTLGNGFNTNTIGNTFDYNIIAKAFNNNTIGKDSNNNVIGNNFFQNNISNDFIGNAIENDFKNNTIGNTFTGNDIENGFENNTIGITFAGNDIENYFTLNSIGNGFLGNDIENFFVGNTILDGFEGNEIGNYFGNDGSGPGSPVQNFIFSDFKYNKIGNFFGNDTNFIGGTNGDGGNIINDGFQFNEIGDNFIFNLIDLNFTNNKIGNDFWFNDFGQNNSDNTIGNLFVGNSGIGGFGNPIGDNFTSNNIGNYSAFNEIDSGFQYNKIGHFFGNAGSGTQNIISNGFNNNNIGNYFGDDGSGTNGGNDIGTDFIFNQIGSFFYSNQIDDNFQRNQIEYSPSSTDFTAGPATHVYGDYNCTIFKRPDGTLRLSYYDNSDVLNITNIDA